MTHKSEVSNRPLKYGIVTYTVYSFDLINPPETCQGARFGNKSLLAPGPFVSEVLEAVQDGLSPPDSDRVHLLYLGSQTLIQVQDLILSEKCFCYHSSATSIAELDFVQKPFQ